MSEIANGDEPGGRSHWGNPHRFGLRVSADRAFVHAIGDHARRLRLALAAQASGGMIITTMIDSYGKGGSIVGSCIYAALHVIGFIIIWAAVVGACVASSGLACALAIIAGVVFSYFLIQSFIKAYNSWRAGRNW
jgi:hypothetical protein